jgi:siroheme synthase-like protein
VGLGRVGRRKLAGLVAAGARVLAVDPNPDADASTIDGVEVRTEAYRAEHLHGACLAIAAGPPEVNRQVVADAAAAAVWVNPASGLDGDESTKPGGSGLRFRVPASWREGGVTLSVSTAGASPALAGALRDRAAAALGAAAAGLATTLAELRPEVFARVADPVARRRVLTDWADPRWIERFASGGPAAVRAELARVLESAAAEGETPAP